MLLIALCTLLVLYSVDSAKLPLSNRRSNRIMSNSLSSNGWNSAKQDWVTISEAPIPVATTHQGAHFELECEAIGSPEPRIQWLRANKPITEADDYESNSISESVGIKKLRSRLVIDQVLVQHAGVFTCVAQSGTASTAAISKVYVTESEDLNSSDNNDGMMNDAPVQSPAALIQATARGARPARVTLWNPVVMEPEGGRIILPCKAIGSPRPDILWIDNYDRIITGEQDPRMKVLPDGELSISGLHWNDMGGFTCIAHNALSKDTVTTFVYPLDEK